MGFHVADDLLDVGLHVLDLAVLLGVEGWLLLDFVLLRVVFVLPHLVLVVLHQIKSSHEDLLLRFGALFHEKVWAEAVFVKFGSPIVRLEVVVYVNQREVGHPIAVDHLRVVEATSVRESRDTVRINRLSQAEGSTYAGAWESFHSLSIS